MQGARLLSPELFERMPIEKAWPWLKKLADRLEGELEGDAQHDWFLRASRRTIYYISCPATRWAFVSAARELALDPAFGPKGVWTRLDQLKIPAAFIWGDQDQLIRMKDVPRVEKKLPHAHQIHVPCAGHFDNGPHFLCLERAAVEGVRLVESDAKRRGWSPAAHPAVGTFGCGVEADGSDVAPDAAVAAAGGSTT
jgi:pimeloyl-ACP methyl ester carboxylesterase